MFSIPVDGILFQTQILERSRLGVRQAAYAAARKPPGLADSEKCRDRSSSRGTIPGAFRFSPLGEAGIPGIRLNAGRSCGNEAK